MSNHEQDELILRVIKDTREARQELSLLRDAESTDLQRELGV